MRIVMLTDDARLIDRRILLEAETLIAERHEVIVIARQGDGAPEAALLGRVKVNWIGTDISYTGGLNDETDLSELIGASSAGDAGAGAGSSKPALQARGGPLFKRRQSARAKTIAGLDAWASPTIAGWRRVRLGLGIARAALTYAMFECIGRPADLARGKPLPWRKGRPDGPRSGPLSESVATPESIEMNAWEEALFHRCRYFDPDVIHCHDLPQLLAAVRAKFALGVPLIYDTHEVYATIGTLTPAQQGFLRHKERACLPHCDAVITVNPFCAAFLEERYGCPPIHVIRNATAVPKGFIRGLSDDRIRKELGLPKEAHILLYQGWIANVGRGLVELVQGMADVREDVHLVMMGYGDFAYFRSIAEKVGAAGRVHFIDAVPWDELVHWSASADAGVIPYQPVDFNHYVCSPNKLFEFIAAGLPIIANDLPYLKHVVEGEGFGIVRAMATKDEMAAAINEAFDPEKRMLETARRQLLHHGPSYEWPVEAESLRRIYAGIFHEQVDGRNAADTLVARRSIDDLIAQHRTASGEEELVSNR